MYASERPDRRRPGAPSCIDSASPARHPYGRPARGRSACRSRRRPARPVRPSPTPGGFSRCARQYWHNPPPLRLALLRRAKPTQRLRCEEPYRSDGDPFRGSVIAAMFSSRGVAVGGSPSNSRTTCWKGRGSKAAWGARRHLGVAQPRSAARIPGVRRGNGAQVSKLPGCAVCTASPAMLSRKCSGRRRSHTASEACTRARY